MKNTINSIDLYMAHVAKLAKPNTQGQKQIVLYYSHDNEFLGLIVSNGEGHITCMDSSLSNAVERLENARMNEKIE